MTPQEAISKIDELSSKGWFFSLKVDRSGWECCVVGRGLAHGRFSSPSFRGAVEQALAQADAMVDDPQVFIKAHEAKIAELTKECFGPDSYLGFEPVDWEPEEPCKLCVKVKASNDADKTVNAETAFYSKAMECLPREVFQALTFEFDFPEEALS